MQPQSPSASAIPVRLAVSGADLVVRAQGNMDATAAHLAVLHPARSRGHATLMSPAFDGSVALRGRELARSNEAMTAGYVSLQRFNGARKGDDLVALNAIAWADCEIRPGSPFHGLPPEDVAGTLLERLDDAGVARPSYVLFSGRGLWCVWLSVRALPPRAQGRVGRVLRALWGEAISTGRGAGSERVSAKAATMAAIWQDLDLDRSVSDMARVHRVAGSINPKSGEVVRLLWPASWVAVERHDLEDLARAVLPFTREETAEYLAERRAARDERQARAKAEGRSFEPRAPRRTYAVHGVVAEELVRLASHLGPDRLRVMGLRDLMAFHIACARARAGLGGDEASWASDLSPLVGLSERKLRTYLKPVATRLRRHEAGETVEYRGRLVSPLYTHRIDRIVSDLGITAEIAAAVGLVRLVPDANVRPALTPAERQAQRRRRQGQRTSQELTRAGQNMTALCLEAMYNGAATVTEVARLLGVTRATVDRAMARITVTFTGIEEAQKAPEAPANEVSYEAPFALSASRSLSDGSASDLTPKRDYTPKAAPKPVYRIYRTAADRQARIEALTIHHLAVFALEREPLNEGLARRWATETVEHEVETGKLTMYWPLFNQDQLDRLRRANKRGGPCGGRSRVLH